MKQKQIILVLTLAVLATCAVAQSIKLDQQPASDLNIEILYDNYIAVDGTKADWGFACAIDINGEQILFDTGTRPNTLIENMDKLNYDLNQVDQIVISHDHHDHVGGLKTVLEKVNNIPVYLPDGADRQLGSLVTKAGGKPEAHVEAKKMAKNVWLSGTMGNQIREQCLVINHEKGLVVITGCSHPGIVDMLDSIKNQFGKEIYAVMGGFHLMQHSKKRIDQIIADFELLGIKNCGCTHCTGDRQIEWFREAYGERFMEMGVGRKVTI